MSGGPKYSRFSQHHSKLLKKFLPFYEALDKGKRVPSTPRQQRFVEVCRGRKAPKFDHEFAYIKFLEFKRSKELQGYQNKGASNERTKQKKFVPPKWLIEQQKNDAARAAARSEYSPHRPEGFGSMPSKEWEGKFDPTRSRQRPKSRGPENKRSNRIPEFEEGAPRPGWFTDQDWKINRGRQKYEGPF